MNRFVEWFYNLSTCTLVAEINEYATEHNLKIISLSANEKLHEAIVVFEGEKPFF